MCFSAHDAEAPNCPLAHMTIAHHLLKVELASAIRQAGWHAELEAAGYGWRADVLAANPDGTTRMAWEAQLAQATIDELTARTETIRASDVDVRWDGQDRPGWDTCPASASRPVRSAATAGPSHLKTEDSSSSSR